MPLTVSGEHREHVIAFARTSGTDAIIVAVCKAMAPFTDGGRSWLSSNQIDAVIDCGDLHVDGAVEMPASTLFNVLPVAVKPARRAQ